MRDINLGDTIYPKFTTRAFASGVPTTLAGTPVLSVYEENNLTQITAGVSVSVDYDSVTGLNQATIVATSGNGYEAGKSYDLVITTGTVGGVSVVGEVVYSFTVEDTTALMPTTAGRTLDVNATGEAGIDLDNTNGTLVTAQFGADFLTDALIADNALVAANFASGSLDGKGDWNVGKTGYTLTQTFPSNFADMAIEVTTGLVSSNVIEISDDSTAADNLELMYDGTGYTDDTAPSSRSQIGQLASGTASISTISESATVTTGTETNTYAVTDQLDGVLHEVADVAGNTEFYYQFDVGGNGVPTEVIWDGYAQSNGDSYAVNAYNWGAASWDQVGSLSGSGGTTIINDVFLLLNSHVGTGANLGKVRFQITSADGTNFATDRVVCSYAVVAQSVGYSGGKVWIDTVNGTAGTETYVNGVADNPSLTAADALTIASNVGLSRFEMSPDSSITFAASRTSEIWEGQGWDLALGGQDVSLTHINHGKITGACTSSTGEVHISYSHLSSLSVGGDTHLSDCKFEDSITITATGTYIFERCVSEVAGSGSPTIDMGAAVGATDLICRDYHGGMTINNLASGDVVTIGGNLGTITLNGADAQVEIRGIAKAVVNNLTGSPTVNDTTIKSSVIDSIQTDTAEIGVAGAGLTDLGGMSTTMKAQVNTEVDTGLSDYDGPTNTEMVAAFTEIKGATWSSSTDTLEDIRDKQTDIETDTQDIQTQIGTAGAGLTDLPLGQVKKNAAFSNFEFLMVLASDHVTPATGLTVTGQRSIDGGAFASVSGTIAEVSNGIYQFDALAADTNGDVITWRFLAATADDTYVTITPAS